MNLLALRRSKWILPALLATGSLVALVTALAADGWWDVVSWILLFLPILVIASALTKWR